MVENLRARLFSQGKISDKAIDDAGISYHDWLLVPMNMLHEDANIFG